MRLLCQQIAVRANDEDQEVGKFWQARFRAVRLLDEQALLARCAYVDLNPIRAAVLGKRGATPKSLPPIFERLSLDPKIWCSLVSSVGRLFYNIAGLPQTIEATASRVTQKRYYVPSGASNLFEEVTEHVSA